jgi:hypothetical protein
MQAMHDARFNAFWYLSFVAPAIVMLATTYLRSRAALVLGALLSLGGTYTLCNLSVQEKWDSRLEMARTDQELEYATADGANLVFTCIAIAPFESIAYTSLWGFVGWRYCPRVRRAMSRLH